MARKRARLVPIWLARVGVRVGGGEERKDLREGEAPWSVRRRV